MTYNWTLPDGSTTANRPPYADTTINSSVIANHDGTWQLVVDNLGCLSPPGTVNVDIYEIPDAIFDPIPDTCPPGLDITMVNNSTQGPGIQYLWTVTGGASFNDNTSFNPTLTIPDNQGNTSVSYTVTLTVTSGNNCVASASNTFLIFGRPDASFSVLDSALCGPIDVTLNNNSTFASNYQWDFITSNASQPVINIGQGQPPAPDTASFPINNGPDSILHTLRLYATNSDGCVDSAFQTFILYPEPIVDFSYSTDSCGPTTISATAVGSNPSLSDPQNGEPISTMTWNWTLSGSPAGNPSSGTSQNFTSVVDNQSTSGVSYTLTLEGTTQHDCIASYSETIDISGLPNATILLGDSTGCADTFIVDGSLLIASTSPSDIAYNWYTVSPPTLPVSNSSSLTLEPGGSSTTFPGSYPLDNPGQQLLVALVVENACGFDTAYRLFEALPNPVIDFDLVPNAICDGDNPQVQNVTLGMQFYSWYIDTVIGGSLAIMQDSIATGPNPSLPPLSNSVIGGSPREYSIRLQAIAVNNCPSEISELITVNALPTVDAGSDVGICLNAGTYDLSDQNQQTTIPASGGVWSGPGVSGSVGRFYV